MSGSTGSSRISRKDFANVLTNYKKLVLDKYKPFQAILPSGSYNSDKKKNSFGDMDLLIQVKGFTDKAEAKKDFIKHIKTYSDDIIVPFQSPKYKGKKYMNTGEIVTISFPQGNGEFVQIDNIFALDQDEHEYKKNFLDMPAQIQGLVLGLIKTITVEHPIEQLLKKADIKGVDTNIKSYQEFEFNISAVELQLRLVTYDPDLLANGQYKQQSREVVWSTKNWKIVNKLLWEYKLDQDFDSLVKQIDNTLQNTRSKRRLAGVFKSMISVKSGEIGTEKGEVKMSAINKVNKIFNENNSLINFKSFMELGKKDKNI